MHACCFRSDRCLFVALGERTGVYLLASFTRAIWIALGCVPPPFLSNMSAGKTQRGTSTTGEGHSHPCEEAGGNPPRHRRYPSIYGACARTGWCKHRWLCTVGSPTFALSRLQLFTAVHAVGSTPVVQYRSQNNSMKKEGVSGLGFMFWETARSALVHSNKTARELCFFPTKYNLNFFRFLAVLRGCPVLLLQ